jgi:hypothetical protein
LNWRQWTPKSFRKEQLNHGKARNDTEQNDFRVAAPSSKR